MNPALSPYTVDQWLEDAWREAIEGAARVVRRSAPTREPIGDSVIIRYGETWIDLFEPCPGRSLKWRCKVCGARGYLDPAEPPPVRWWTTDHLNGHEECHICGRVFTARGMSHHRWVHSKGLK